MTIKALILDLLNETVVYRKPKNDGSSMMNHPGIIENPSPKQVESLLSAQSQKHGFAEGATVVDVATGVKRRLLFNADTKYDQSGRSAYDAVMATLDRQLPQGISQRRGISQSSYDENDFPNQHHFAVHFHHYSYDPVAKAWSDDTESRYQRGRQFEGIAKADRPEHLGDSYVAPEKPKDPNPFRYDIRKPIDLKYNNYG